MQSTPTQSEQPAKRALPFVSLFALLTLIATLPALPLPADWDSAGGASAADEEKRPLLLVSAALLFAQDGLLQDFAPRPLLIALLLLLVLAPLAFYVGYRMGRRQGDPR